MFHRLHLRRLLLIPPLLAALAGHTAEIVPRMLLLDGVTVGREIIAVGERGTILRSTDSAKTWQTVSVPATATLTGVSFAADGKHGWAVGHDALILTTADGGLTWQKQWQGKNLSDSFLDVLVLDADHVIAIGAFGLYLATTDGGHTWTQRRLLDDDYHLNRLSRGPTGTLYLAGEHGTLLRSSDRGATWTPIDSPYDGSFYGILPLDDHTLLAHGLRGRLYRSTDDGETWQAIANDQRVLLATAVRPNSGTVVIAGQARSFFVSRDQAQTVAAWAPELKTAVAELLVTPDGTLLALGESGATRLPNP